MLSLTLRSRPISRLGVYLALFVIGVSHGRVALALSEHIHLTPANIAEYRGEKGYPQMIVKVAEASSGLLQIRIIVYPSKNANPPHAKLTLRQEDKVVLECLLEGKKLPPESKEVDDAIKDKCLVYTFTAANVLSTSARMEVVWGYSINGAPMMSDTTFWFDLKDFQLPKK